MNKTKLSEKAYEILREDIMNLKLEPGSILYELQLSKEMDISRTPIRQALQRLVSEGLVEIKGENKSYFYVDNLSIKNFRDICQIRTALESLSVELTLLNHKPEDIEILKSIIEEQDKLIENNADMEKMLNMDRDFHSQLAMISKNTMLAEEIDKIIDLYYRYNYYALSTNNRFKQANNEHRKIIEVIETGDLDAIKNLMNLHLSKTNENILFKLASIRDSK